jgi:hypothetical protein
MKVHLLHPDRDFDRGSAPPPQSPDLAQDLGLDVLLATMAAGDNVIRTVAEQALLASLQDCDVILYRQQALADAIKHPDAVRALYDLAVDTLREEKQIWSWHGYTPEMNLHHAVNVLQLLTRKLRVLRQRASENAQRFSSPAFGRLFATLLEELDDTYFGEIEEQLERLRFRRGVLVSEGLGRGSSGVGVVLRRPLGARRGWLRHVRERGDPRLKFEISPRDDGGHAALDELRARGINLVADALSQSSDHVLSFFTQLRAELAFYVGCLNLHAELERRGYATSFPAPHSASARILGVSELYDVVLALTMPTRVVANDLSADGKGMVLITGANRGGKSTFLRSVGLAQLMMQAGMFVPATSFSADLASGVFTHFMREEDETMTRGKLDEELDRMSRVVDLIGPRALLLCNESFGSTNELEGADIGEQVLRALTDAGVRVVLVTHLYELARRLSDNSTDGVLSLRAERLPDGTRTFKVREAGPLRTSFGNDVYAAVFGGVNPTAQGDATAEGTPV